MSVMSKLDGGQSGRPFIRLMNDLKIGNIDAVFGGNRLDLFFIADENGIGDAAVLGRSYGFQNSAVLSDSNGYGFLSAFLHLGNQSVKTCTHLSAPHSS